MKEHAVGYQVLKDLTELAVTTAETFPHAPYSKTRVGAAAVSDSGHFFTGFNLETASWAVSVHAEVALLVEWVKKGRPQITHLLCATSEGAVIPPCGQCRQVLFEYMGGDVLIATAENWVPLGNLLPMAFTEKDLAG